MSENSEIQLGDYIFNLNHFFRYIYSGFILCLIIILLFPEQSKELYSALGGNNLQGSIFLIFLLIAIGTGFYVSYKAIVSELLIDNLHLKKPVFLLFHSDEDCIFKYLGTLGVEEKHRLTAFRLIRSKVFEPLVQKTFHLRHSETHVLYLTFTACIVGLLMKLLPFNCSTFNIKNDALIIGITGIISLLSGLHSDKKICTDECYYSKLNEDKIKDTLKNAKLLKDTP